MKVEVWNKEGAVLLTRSGGESMKVSLPEFWEICRIGQRMDVRDEIENYLDNGGKFEGVDADTIRGNAAFMDEVVEQVISDRTKDESGDQIYEAICYCVKYGKNKNELVASDAGKAISDIYEEDFQDVERRKEFGKLIRESRMLRFELSAQNSLPQGGDRDTAESIKLRLGDVTHRMDLLRVKEWLSKQPYDLDTESAGHREAMEMLEEICEWYFPELAEMVFGNSDGDLIFREPGEVVGYDWYYYNPDAISGGQIVVMPFSSDEGCRMFGHMDPISVVENKCLLEDIDKIGFFITIFDMLQMKEDGWFIGTDIQEVCQDIFAEQCKQGRYVVSDSVSHSVWHGDVDVSYGFPGLDEIDYDSMELAAEGLLKHRLGSVGLFEDIRLERVGYYKNGVGFNFSFTANVDERVAGQLLQKALDGLRFEAYSDVQKQQEKAKVDDVIYDAKARTGLATDGEKQGVEMEI